MIQRIEVLCLSIPAGFRKLESVRICIFALELFTIKYVSMSLHIYVNIHIILL